jgi:hypothetical protein
VNAPDMKKQARHELLPFRHDVTRTTIIVNAALLLVSLGQTLCIL